MNEYLLSRAIMILFKNNIKEFQNSLHSVEGKIIQILQFNYRVCGYGKKKKKMRSYFSSMV